MDNLNYYSTVNFPELDESNAPDETSYSLTQSTVAQHKITDKINVYTDTLASEQEPGDENFDTATLQIPLPSKSRQAFRDKTIAKWSIERRRVAKNLLNIWKQASEKINEPDFAFHVHSLVSEIDLRIPDFRDIPHEDTFSGILQLIRDAITGHNFCRIQKDHLDKPIKDVFVILTDKERLNLKLYEGVLKTLMKHNLVSGRG